VLSALLAVVLVVQLKDGQAEYEVAALAEDAAVADAEPAPAEAAAEALPAPQDNAVLSQAPPELETLQNTFTSFWNRGAAEAAPETIAPPPSVVLALTIPGGEHPVAVVDGSLRFLGDRVQGWILAEVRPRAIVLRSPAGQQLVVEMPVFQRQLVPEDGLLEVTSEASPR
jgi:hypothetical protein